LHLLYNGDFLIFNTDTSFASCNFFAMSTNRYVEPIPESLKVVKTRPELQKLAHEYPLGGLDQQNGGYYYLDEDNNVIAAAADSLCEEFDTTLAKLEQHPEAEVDDTTTSCSKS
jgi:hypothetical protein